MFCMKKQLRPAYTSKVEISYVSRQGKSITVIFEYRSSVDTVKRLAIGATLIQIHP